MSMAAQTVKKKGESTESTMQVQVGVEFKFLNRDLNILFENKKVLSNDTTLKLNDYVREETDVIKKVTFLLAPNNPQTGTGITLDKIIEDFKSFFGGNSGDDAKKQIEDQVSDKSKLNSIIFKLKTAFLYTSYYEISGESGESKGKWDATTMKKCTDDKPSWEYAVSLEIDSTELFGNIELFTIEKTSISLWNTTRDSVLKMMSLGSADEILKRLDA